MYYVLEVIPGGVNISRKILVLSISIALFFALYPVNGSNSNASAEISSGESSNMEGPSWDMVDIIQGSIKDAEEGDVIFGFGPKTVDGLNPFGHVGIIYKRDDKLWVVEALPEYGVTKDYRTPEIFDTMYDQVKLVRYSDSNKARAAAEWAASQAGKPYTDSYLSCDVWRDPKLSKFYCSMLVWKAFAAQGVNISAKNYFGFEFDPNTWCSIAPRDIMRSPDLNHTIYSNSI